MRNSVAVRSTFAPSTTTSYFCRIDAQDVAYLDFFLFPLLLSSPAFRSVSAPL